MGTWEEARWVRLARADWALTGLANSLLRSKVYYVVGGLAYSRVRVLGTYNRGTWSPFNHVSMNVSPQVSGPPAAPAPTTPGMLGSAAVACGATQSNCNYDRGRSGGGLAGLTSKQAASISVALALLIPLGYYVLSRRRRGTLSQLAAGASVSSTELTRSRPARIAAIEALPSRTVPVVVEATAVPAPCECAICLSEPAVGESLTTLPCGHEFHSRCIRTWLEASMDAACPLCKGVVFPVH